MIPHAARIGEEVIGPRLQKLKQAHPSVGDVRGMGVFWAIELVADRDTREPLAPYGQTAPVMNEIVAECRRHGVLPFMNMNRLHVCPPLNVSEEEALFGLDGIDKALALADREVSA